MTQTKETNYLALALGICATIMLGYGAIQNYANQNGLVAIIQATLAALFGFFSIREAEYGSIENNPTAKTNDTVDIAIGIVELEALANAALTGVGEGCNDSYRALRTILPSILTKHEMVYITEAPDFDIKIIPADEYFTPKKVDLFSKYYHSVFNKHPDLRELTAAYNQIEYSEREYLTEFDDSEFMAQILTGSFNRIKQQSEQT